jgi:hypothetical protein
VPVFVWASRAEKDWARANLAALARKGIIVAVDTPTYQNMRTAMGRTARNELKPFTSHNEKLGFDYSSELRRYVGGKSPATKHPQTSAYLSFLQDAITFHQQNTSYKDHLSRQVANFTSTVNDIASKQRAQMQGQTALPDFVSNEYTRTISGLKDEITLLNEELREARD